MGVDEVVQHRAALGIPHSDYFRQLKLPKAIFLIRNSLYTVTLVRDSKLLSAEPVHSCHQNLRLVCTDITTWP